MVKALLVVTLTIPRFVEVLWVWTQLNQKWELPCQTGHVHLKTRRGWGAGRWGKETLLTNVRANEKHNFESRWCSNTTDQLLDVGAHSCTLHLIKDIFGSLEAAVENELERVFWRLQGLFAFSRINEREVKSLRTQVWQACKFHASKDSFNFFLFILSCNNNARTMILLRLKGQKSKSDTFCDSIKGTRRQS